MRIALASSIVVVLLFACTSQPARDKAKPTSPALSTAARAQQIVSTLSDRNVQALALELRAAKERLAFGDERGAGMTASERIEELYEVSRPLNDQELNLLYEFGLVAREAGFKKPAARADGRVLFQHEHPGESFTSFDWDWPVSAEDGQLVGYYVPQAKDLRDVLDKLDALADSAAGTADGATPTDPRQQVIPAGSARRATTFDQDVLVDPEQLSNLLRRAREDVATGEFESAIADLEQLLKESARVSNPPAGVVREAQVLLAEIELRRGNLDRAEELLRAAVASWNADDKAESELGVNRGYWRLILLLVAEGRFADAVGLTQEVADAGSGSRESITFGSAGSLGAVGVGGLVASDPEVYGRAGTDVGAATDGDPELDRIYAAWDSGDREKAFELAEDLLSQALASGASSERTVYLRLVVASFALETGRLERARALVASILAGDADVTAAEGEQRGAALALRARIENRDEQQRRAEAALAAKSPGGWWNTDESTEPASWPRYDTGPFTDALRTRSGEPQRTRSDAEDSLPFDFAAARGEAARLQRACSLEEALELRRRITAAYRGRRSFNDPDRLDALREEAALLRVLGYTRAAREVEESLGG